MLMGRVPVKWAGKKRLVRAVQFSLTVTMFPNVPVAATAVPPSKCIQLTLSLFLEQAGGVVAEQHYHKRTRVNRLR